MANRVRSEREVEKKYEVVSPSTPRLATALNTDINVSATNVHDRAIHSITTTLPAFVKWVEWSVIFQKPLCMGAVEAFAVCSS